MADIKGTFDERFAAVADVLSANLDRGADVGASACVVHEGETVVDIWGGTIDDQGTPWAEDTIINVWSTTKTMTALTALLLADRGELDFHTPVAHYWAEFAANGKEAVEVRLLMGHTAGLSGWQEPMTEADVCDWEKATSLLAAQAPWWEPGTASGYHALNQGHLVGEVVRRITGLSLGQFFAKEVAGPLGADFHIGLAPEHDHRVSNVVPPPPLPIDLATLDPDSVMVKTFTGPAPAASIAWTEAWRRAELPAANGHGNARSVARLQSIVASEGEVDGVRLLSPETCKLIFDEQTNGIDLVLGAPLRFGIGYGLKHPESSPYLPDGRVCFWGGWGGSVIIVDLDRRMTIAYMMNRMEGGLLGDPRGEGLVVAAYAAVDG